MLGRFRLWLGVGKIRVKVEFIRVVLTRVSDVKAVDVVSSIHQFGPNVHVAKPYIEENKLSHYYLLCSILDSIYHDILLL